MKTHQFRCLLFFSVLIFIGITSLVYSQDASEQSNDEPTSVEQPSETPNPLESRVVNSLEKQTMELKHELSKLRDALDNPFQTYAIIFGAIIVLTIVVMFFLSTRKIRQLRNEFENSERGRQNRLNEINQRREGQLKHIRRQGKDNTEKIEEIVSNHSRLHDEQKNFQNALSKLGSRLDGFELTLMNLDLDKVPDETVHEQLQLEEVIQEVRTQAESLVQTYENGEPIDWTDIENPTPSQTTLQILNWIARSVEDWKDDLEQSGEANPDFIQTLGYANQIIKDKLKEVRGPAPPVPKFPEVETNVSTDAAYHELLSECTAYVSRYEGLLIGFQLGCTVDETEYNQFIPQFIKDRLFNSVARFIEFDRLSEQLGEYLQLVGYEVVPIEIGKTQADARIHDIQSSRQDNVEVGTIAEVVLPGLQRIDNSEIIQKPVVIRAE